MADPAEAFALAGRRGGALPALVARQSEPAGAGS